MQQDGCDIHSTLGIRLGLLSDSWTEHEISGTRAHQGGGSLLSSSWELGDWSLVFGVQCAKKTKILSWEKRKGVGLII